MKPIARRSGRKDREASRVPLICVAVVTRPSFRLAAERCQCHHGLVSL